VSVRQLLLSNSTNHGEGYLDHALDQILAFLGPVRKLTFVPYALGDRRSYTAKVAARLQPVGITVEGLEDGLDAGLMLASAEAVFVGGGNTFRLLSSLQRGGLLAPLRERVLGGMPYMGSSAGTNIAAPTIRTTNDMPILEPAGFDALGLVPFQINPHYIDADPSSSHMGETREERLREYLEENTAPVIGLREGAWLLREDGSLRLHGRVGARLFRRGQEPTEHAPGSDLSFLLES
jgi:dipeptidase E